MRSRYLDARFVKISHKLKGIIFPCPLVYPERHAAPSFPTWATDKHIRPPAEIPELIHGIAPTDSVLLVSPASAECWNWYAPILRLLSVPLVMFPQIIRPGPDP